MKIFENVCYLSGYGAYGSSITPFFSFIDLDLIQHGVIIAYAHVRGGGEKGNDWYLGGFKTTKPNTWKDFIAWAEYLISQKYTSIIRDIFRKRKRYLSSRKRILWHSVCGNPGIRNFRLNETK